MAHSWLRHEQTFEVNISITVILFVKNASRLHMCWLNNNTDIHIKKNTSEII